MNRHTFRAALHPVASLILASALGLCACGGSDSGGTDGGGGGGGAAQFTVAGTTQTFDASECTASAAGDVYQIMCAQAGGSPSVNMVVQAPPDAGSYDQTVPNVAVSVVDPTTGVQILCSGGSGSCTVVVTGTAAPGQGAWQGHFDATDGQSSATGTFDVQVTQ